MTGFTTSHEKAPSKKKDNRWSEKRSLGIIIRCRNKKIDAVKTDE